MQPTLANILPHEWFTALPGWLLLLILVVALVVLIKGADWLVENAAAAAYRLGLSKVIIGATIVSLGTTSPEAAVSVMAAWSGNAGLALGNGVGSIIVDTGLIFGLGCLLTQLPADRFVLRRQGWVQVGAATLLALLCYVLFFMDGEAAALGRWVGVLFALLLAAYMVISVHWSRAHPHGEPHLIAVDDHVDLPRVTGGESHVETGPALPQLALWGFAGLALVVLGSDVLVNSATELAERAEVPQIVIAATLVAFGTSLPELVVGITSIRKGHGELLVGNIIGADILNVLFVIGFAALARPLPIFEAAAVGSDRSVFLWLHLPTMLIMLAYMRLCIVGAGRRGYFSRWMGAPLVLAYLVYVAIQLLFTGG